MHDETQYYTPYRVRYWLDRYPALAVNLPHHAARRREGPPR